MQMKPLGSFPLPVYSLLSYLFGHVMFMPFAEYLSNSNCCFNFFFQQFVCLQFMNSRSAAASTVSCKTGNKNKFLFCFLICLFPRFLGSPVSFVNFLLFKAVVRSPSSSVPVYDISGEILP